MLFVKLNQIWGDYSLAPKTHADISTKQIILYATFLNKIKRATISSLLTAINWFAGMELTHPRMAHLLSVDCNQ